MQYSKIFITNLPAFYKINLFNRLNEQKRIFVVFTGEDLIKRNKDFSNTAISFDYLDLSGYSKFKKIIYIIKLIFTFKFDEIVVGGWDQIYYWIVALLNKTKKNGVIVESSIFESKQIGIKKRIKNIFLSNFKKIYVSGPAQKDLVESIFDNIAQIKDKEIITTGGVGLFRYSDQPRFAKKNVIKNFIYVGRLSQEKNLQLLVRVFNSLPDLHLTIVGEGILFDELNNFKNNNIEILGYLPNDKLSEIFKKNDVFILPSIFEPWGLVVEEALNNGLPIILSNRVGCYPKYIKKHGVLFIYDEETDLHQAINKMVDVQMYNQFAYEISTLNFSDISDIQVSNFL